MSNEQQSRIGLRGFGSMDKDLQREIARRGGRAAQQMGRAHKFSSEEAVLAARKGQATGMAHKFTVEEARAAGRKGGLARAMNYARSAEAPVASVGEEQKQFSFPVGE